MTLIKKNSQIYNDAQKVIKIIESVKTKEQLDVALKFFYLFNAKYPNKPETHYIKSKFWAIYKNKKVNFTFD